MYWQLRPALIIDVCKCVSWTVEFRTFSNTVLEQSQKPQSAQTVQCSILLSPWPTFCSSVCTSLLPAVGQEWKSPPVTHSVTQETTTQPCELTPGYILPPQHKPRSHKVRLSSLSLSIAVSSFTCLKCCNIMFSYNSDHHTFTSS